MKSLLILSVLFPAALITAQMPAVNEFYQKIENYYLKNPGSVEYIELIHKDALSYDTLHARFAYVPYNNKACMIARFGDEYFIRSGLLAADDNYFLDAYRAEKIKIKNKELEGTDYSDLDYIPSYNCSNLEKAFGSIKSYNKVKGQYQLLTSKYLLKVDTLTYRINSLTRYDMFEGKIQVDEYRFISLSDSIQKFIRKQTEDLIEASKNFPVTTFKEIEKNRVQVKSFEGQKFSFQNLVSFNKSSLDSVMKDKYVIFDFFYLSCYPCHKMTGWILDWIPSIDTDKIILIGIDPRDAEPSMKLFVKDKKISYPIIIGQQAKDIVHHYQIRAYPTLFLLSPDGKIQAVHEGMSKSFLTKAEKIVSR